jgi:cytochrome c2
MKRLVLLVVAGIIAVMFCAPLYAQDAANGEKVFAREKCGMCHTATRNSLKDVGSKLTADQIKEWIKNPKQAAANAKSTAKPPMRSFEKLADKDVNDLVAYLQTMKGGK